MFNNLKRILGMWMWKNHRSTMLGIRGFECHTIQNDKEFLDFFVEIHEHNRTLMGIREVNNIYRLVKHTQKIEGDIAEVGVYRGGSAKIICKLKKDKTLYLFDTFEGMPKVNKSIDKLPTGHFADTSIENVKEYLKEYTNVHFYKGFFPESAKNLENISIKYSFVNLDVDIYESTLNCLNYFYPKLNRGGILVSHDYNSISCPGVKKAFDEFFTDKPETVIELWDSQSLIVKL